MTEIKWIKESDSCTRRSAKSDTRAFVLFLVALVIVHSGTVVGALNQIGILTLEMLFPGYVSTETGLVEVAWVAALLEPLTSKLLPVALFVFGGTVAIYTYAVMLVSFGIFWWFDLFGLTPIGHLGLGMLIGGVVYVTWPWPKRSVRHRLPCAKLPEHRWLIGALVGLTFGIVELYSKLVFMDGEFLSINPWAYSSYSPEIWLPVGYHVVEGIVVVGAFLTVLEADKSTRRKVATVGGALLVMMAVHFTWNTWLVHQVWFWEAWVDAYETITAVVR